MQKLSLGLIVGVLILSLVGCGGQAEETPTPEMETRFAGMVSVTGEMLPAEWGALGARTGGLVMEILVEPGDQVAAGDPLVRLDLTDATLAVQQAEAALASAQAQLALLKAQPRPEDVAAAQDRLDAAEAAIAQAAAERDRLSAGAIEADIAATAARVAEAEAGRKEAQIHYDQMQKKEGVDQWQKDEAALRLRGAEQTLEAAQVQLAQAQKGADARRRQANAAVWIAEAQRDLAQAELDRLQVGATEEEIARAQTEVARAQVELESARLRLERCELYAPFDGTVGVVEAREGEQIAPGDVLVKLGDLSTLRVETTDLDEMDVARVEVGQRVQVTFDALPERVFVGRVIRVSPMAESEGGGVTYTTIIELDELDPLIRWGMTALVDIEVGQ